MAICLLVAAAACIGYPERTGEGVKPAPLLPFAVGAPRNLGSVVNGPGFDGGPSLSLDGRDLYFVSDRPGGDGGGDIWVARRSAADKSFEVVENLGGTVNSAGNEGAPSLAGNGRMLFFECFESDPSSSCHRPSQGVSDIWMSTRSRSGGFSTITKLGRPVNGPAADSFPDITSDGSALYFASNRPGGFGDFDLWVAHRAPGGHAFETVEDLGPAVNSTAYDGDPAISPDGLVLIFASNRPGGSGGEDLWVATRGSTEDVFGTPSNLGPGLNTAGFEGRPALSGDARTLYLMSDRPGGNGGIDLWRVELQPS